jgi:SAM-dependent methyltransferase
MEHVRDDRSAHAEIFRCLRPGGTYLFTIPYAESRERTHQLVDTSTAEDIFLQPPHYHGDPITGKILAYRLYGRDVIDRLQEVGYRARFEKTELPAEGIFAGDCFIATKSSGPVG